ncbi:helix-turn-helix domain-containing protein [Telmatospirillum sp.]|uniref:helix-turn-helix domain-containing protein n=1 Tax=Telmatospirillum sp. TaxID=2079197 RepID=UPI002850209E|nr:helix-turn-helix domain-containing protein [Telmatospirillum sp.]MDR3437255.1 helix-turn-helix domain-containing protein [Telmatospirillum sp.]
MNDIKSAELIQSFGFNRQDYLPDENYAAWQEAVKLLFDIDANGRKDLPEFYADLASYSMGSVLLGYARAATQRFSRSVDTIARGGIDHFIAQLYIEGGYHGVAGGKPIEVQAGDICVLDCAGTLETLATDFENLTLVVPRAMLESKLTRPEALHGLVLRGGSAMTQVLSRHLLALFELAPRMTLHECDSMTRGTIALIVACLQGELERREDQTAAGKSITVLRIRRYIDDRLSSPDVNAETIAAQFALSRASLYRLFEPFGGVADYIRNKRLRRAFFELRSPEFRGHRVGEIARRWGFSNEGTFARAFKAAYGVSPNAVRDTSQLDMPSTDPDSADDRPIITRWMHEISGDGHPTGGAG